MKTQGIEAADAKQTAKKYKITKQKIRLGSAIF